MVKVQARVNPETKMLDLSDGRSLPISARFKAELFPETTEESLQGEEMAKIRRQAPSEFGEALFQIGEGSNIARGAKDVTNYISSIGEAFAKKKGQEGTNYWERQGQNYEAKRRANEALSEEFSEESPTASLLGKGVGIGSDLFATGGLSAAKALPVLTAAGKGTDLARDPIQSIKDIGISAAEGWVGDRIVGGLSKIAGRRGAIRQNAIATDQVAAQNAAGEAQNILAQGQVSQANKQAIDNYKQQLATRKQDIINLENQRNAAVFQRDQQITQLKNQAAQAKAARASNAHQLDQLHKQSVEAWKKDIDAIDKEYKAAVNEYQQTVSQLPDLQKAADAEYSAEVLRNAKKIETVMAKDDRILGSAINPNQFFEEVVNVSEYAASKEAREAQQFLNKLFPENAILSSKDLVKRYEALEAQIAKASPEKAKILLDFKAYLGNRLPQAIESSVAYRQVIPHLKKDLFKATKSFAKEANLPNNIVPRLEHNIENSIRSLSPNEFSQKLMDGSLKQELKNSIISNELANIHDIDSIIKGRKFVTVGGKKTPADQFRKTLEQANASEIEKIKDLSSKFDQVLDDVLQKYTVDIDIAKGHVKKRLGKAFEHTLGKAESVSSPVPPFRGSYPPEPVKPPAPAPIASPNLPPPIPPVVQPPLPAQPNLQAAPPFNPQAAPILPQAQGVERLGDALENFKFGDLLQTKSLTNNPVTKLAGLKYVLGKAALPVEVAAGLGIAGMKGLTAPTSIGQFVRQSVVKHGYRGLYTGFDAFARQNYQTYQNGVIKSPEERFKAAYDVENDPNLDIEQKAMLQKKINRGEPIR